jgi:NAD-dependent deacetylase sirtuin 4
MTHYSIAALQRMGYFTNYITQNVDSLHHAATPSPSLAASTILELHGTLQSVVCVSSFTSSNTKMNQKRPVDPAGYASLTQSHLLGSLRKQASPLSNNTPTGEAYPRGCGFRGSRAMYQQELAARNPKWEAFAQEIAIKKTKPKTNPDGDVDLGDADYSSFNYAPCPNCGGALKPAVIFFGESVPDKLRDHSHQLVNECESMVLIGTSLATYSAYRLVKSAHEQGKRTINLGPTRADPLVDDKIELGSSQIMNAVARKLAGNRAEKDPVLHRLLESGVTVQRNRGIVTS